MYYRLTQNINKNVIQIWFNINLSSQWNIRLKFVYFDQVIVGQPRFGCKDTRLHRRDICYAIVLRTTPFWNFYLFQNSNISCLLIFPVIFTKELSPSPTQRKSLKVPIFPVTKEHKINYQSLTQKTTKSPNYNKTLIPKILNRIRICLIMDKLNTKNIKFIAN